MVVLLALAQSADTVATDQTTAQAAAVAEPITAEQEAPIVVNPNRPKIGRAHV